MGGCRATCWQSHHIRGFFYGEVGSGKRDLGGLEPKTATGWVCPFPSPRMGFSAAVRQRQGSSEWLSLLTSLTVEERQEDFRV